MAVMDGGLLEGRLIAVMDGGPLEGGLMVVAHDYLSIQDNFHFCLVMGHLMNHDQSTMFNRH